MLFLAKRSIYLCFLLIWFLFDYKDCSALEDFYVDMKIRFNHVVSQNMIEDFDQITLDLKEQSKSVNTKKGRPFDIKKFKDICASKKVDRVWTEWVSTFLTTHNITEQTLKSSLFYPIDLIYKSYKKNFNQLSLLLKMSLLIAAEAGNNEAILICRHAHYSDVFDDEGEKSFSHLVINDINEFFEIIKTPFVTQNLYVLNSLKKFFKNNNASVLGTTPADLSPLQNFNLGLLLRDLKFLDESIPFFQYANNSGIHRALIEIGNVYLELNDFSVAKNYFETECGGYGVWKLAQCYRYGIGTPRNLSESNQLYLRALVIDRESDKWHIPEIYYDAADFVVYCALSQKDIAKRNSTLRRARDLYIMAGNNNMPLGFIRAAEISAELENDLSEDAKQMTIHAAQKGLFGSAKILLEKYKKWEALDIRTCLNGFALM